MKKIKITILLLLLIAICSCSVSRNTAIVTNKPDTSKKQGSYSSNSYTIKAEQGDIKFKEPIPIP